MNKKFTSGKVSKEVQESIFKIGIPLLLVFLIYGIFRIEIVSYFNQLVVDSQIVYNSEFNTGGYSINADILNFKTIWVINYTLLFLSFLSFFNISKLKNRSLGELNLLGIMLALVVFLVQGLYAMSELRDSYIEPIAPYLDPSIFNILIRYISYSFVGLILVACYRHILQDFISANHRMAFNLVLHASLLWIASSELINWMDLADSTQSYKLGLSILWGVYSLFLIILGINKKKKYLRLGALLIFAVTLVKLFFYDIMDLGTIAKTIVFVSLGILLLIISFLYNKFKVRIAEQHED